MTQVQGSSDCRNSPKNAFAQDVAVALECGEISPDTLGDDVIWQQASGQTLEGKSAVLEHLEDRPAPKSVTVQHAISHGKIGAVIGEVTMEGNQARRFCHVFEFTNTKANCVAVIRSYS